MQWKKRSEAAQTLRAGYSKAEPKILASPQTPFTQTDRGDYNTLRRSLARSVISSFCRTTQGKGIINSKSVI